MVSQIRLRSVERKSSLAIELIANRYRNGWACLEFCAGESGASSTRISIERSSRLLEVLSNKVGCREEEIRISRVRQDQGTAGISQAMEYDLTSERPRASKSFRPMPDAGV
ncbi:hypothetical protein BSZ19_14475 [Bradyrhizobium japonicum]|uniref:Uncharacterized protein n=1 Tax=Bradyrhizobium japonicum TaxID=375 RepID=A0A1Y2JR71_BRAJP|nr:hypothetical protein BSZ19_14475 [Bradyrhizobium japonicum]